MNVTMEVNRGEKKQCWFACLLSKLKKGAYVTIPIIIYLGFIVVVAVIMEEILH